MTLLKVAISRVPAVRYALGLVGVAAAVALVSDLGLRSELGLVSALAMFAGMFLLLVFAGAAKLSPRGLLPQAAVLLWTFTLLCVAWSTLLTTSYFFAWPVPSSVRADSDELNAATQKWINVATRARKAGILDPKRPPPMDVVEARSSFEKAWMNADVASRRALGAEEAYSALSLTARVYRVQEKDSVTKPNAMKWVDQAIAFFEENNDTHFLVESLMDKGAIYLEASQIEHSDPHGWERLASDGESVMERACARASQEQDGDCLRIWSRFLYNLARPRDGNLAKAWDPAYLGASYEKMKQACDLAPNLSNAIQLARVAQKSAANPPNDEDDTWTANLDSARERLEERWREEERTRRTAEKRIPVLNIRGVITLDVVERRWRLDREHSDSASLARLLKDIALPSQHECIALLPNTEWEEDYDFDMRYDLARMYGMLCQIRTGESPALDQACSQVKVELAKARKVAQQTQWNATRLALRTEPHFSSLPRAVHEDLLAWAAAEAP